MSAFFLCTYHIHVAFVQHTHNASYQYNVQFIIESTVYIISLRTYILMQIFLVWSSRGAKNLVTTPLCVHLFLRVWHYARMSRQIKGTLPSPTAQSGVLQSNHICLGFSDLDIQTECKYNRLIKWKILVIMCIWNDIF